MDPFRVLGVTTDATEVEVRAAWKRLALSEHPDAGGSHERMTQLNQALHQCLAQMKSIEDAPNRQARTVSKMRRRISQEMSSFTVSVLPVECWHALEIVAAQCGPIISSEPPYLLEFFLQDTHLEYAIQSWCRCDLVPEAGSTTVHVTVGSVHDNNAPDLEELRDFLVNSLNELDWPTD